MSDVGNNNQFIILNLQWIFNFWIFIEIWLLCHLLKIGNWHLKIIKQVVCPIPIKGTAPLTQVAVMRRLLRFAGCRHATTAPLRGLSTRQPACAGRSRWGFRHTTPWLFFWNRNGHRPSKTHRLFFTPAVNRRGFQTVHSNRTCQNSHSPENDKYRVLS